MSDNLPRMDYRQHRRARRLVHECCNYDEGNCLLLDDGEPCVCVQSISYYIDRLSCHIASSGRTYRSHAATIYKWAQEDAAKKAPKKGIPDYSCKEGESL